MRADIKAAGIGNLAEFRSIRFWKRAVLLLISGTVLALCGVSQPARHVSYMPDEPEMHSRDHRLSLTLVAYTGADGRSHFRSSAGTEPPAIRVWPGDTVDITYKNELTKHSQEKCATGPCMDMTNLHFHGLSVSPQYGQDDAIDMIANPGESLHYSLHIPHDQLPGLFWYHTHPHGESMRQDLDGMSGAIVVEGMDQYVPEVRGLREQILVLRAQAVNEHNNREITSLERMLNIRPTGCGSQAGELERVFTVNDTLRPSIEIAPHERQFWRIVNAAPDRYVDLRLDHQSFEVVAMDGMPLAYSAPHRPTLKMDHVLLPPGARVEAIVEGPEQNAHATLRSMYVNTGPDGDWNPGMVLADIVPHSPPDPARYLVASDYIAPAPKRVSVARYESAKPDFVATFTEDEHGFYINGEKYRPTSGPMKTARVGTYQHWRIVNKTREIHPMHIHQAFFWCTQQMAACSTDPSGSIP
jgi:FtsP/CotA-like multicopper oxidase with cupredoxin domain